MKKAQAESKNTLINIGANSNNFPIDIQVTCVNYGNSFSVFNPFSGNAPGVR